MKPWHIAWRIGLVVLSFTIFISIGFTITSWVASHDKKQHHWEHMLDSGAASAALIRADAGATDDLLRQLAQLLSADVALIDAAGNSRAFGADAAALLAGIDPQAVDTILGGDTIKRFNGWNPVKPGIAMTGQSASLDGHPAALFIRTYPPSLFDGYVRQLATFFTGFVLLFITMFTLAKFGSKRRQDGFQIMIDAVRKIAKGDYTVKLEAKPEQFGPLGKLAQSINEMASELEQMEQMRQEFISNVSHEIQSPLTSISGFSRALQEDEQMSREERLQVLGIIETESKRLSKLSDNLLKLTSLESKHHPFEPKRYRLDKQLRKLVLACEPQWVAKNIEFDVELDQVTVLADEDAMSQVWVNLLNNSIKFTPHDGKIGIRLERRDDAVVVSIADNGCGIAEEDQPFVFDRFFKADKSRNRERGGSGLGLSIVKKIVDMHHGTVTVSSKKDEGATFVVSLPNSSS